MKIGIIGTGVVARALAPKFVAAGHSVVLASREPESKSGLPAPVVGYDALKSVDVIVVAVTGTAELDVLKGIGSETFGDKVVIDAGNAFDANYELAYPTESLGEKVQAAFPEAKVVKALNTFGTAVMTNPASLSARSNAFISGNDDAAKAIAIDLHEALGWSRADVIDLGPITSARAQERFITMLMALSIASKGAPFNVAIVR